MKLSTRFVCECREYSRFCKSVAAPLFRKSILSESMPDKVDIAICGLGFYDLFINGQKVTKGYLAPYISNTDHYTYFDEYNLRPYWREGENVIAVMLGDGFQNEKTPMWNSWNNMINSAPKLALTLEIISGENTVSYDAMDFVCKKGPVLFNDLRAGVFYDARLWEDGWTSPGFTETEWHAPLIAERPRGKARVCQAEPIRLMRELTPISVRRGEMKPYTCNKQLLAFPEVFETFAEPLPCAGGYLYDFGENNAGIYRLRITGTAGQRVDIQCAEQLTDGKINYDNIGFYPDGFCQRDSYILRGEGEEVFEPMFTYHGFRYLYVYGITEQQATTDLLTYLVLSSDLEERGTFHCSDEVANKLYDMGRRSDRANFFYFPTDCPHREKQGWTGDAAMSAEHMIMTMGTEKSWREWLHNVRAAQTEDGQLPGVVPTGGYGYGWGNGPAWDIVLFHLPYFAYRFRGDTAIIRDNATAMLRYLGYVSNRRDARGIVQFGLGDLVPTGKAAGDGDSDLGFTDSVMVLDMCRKATEMFMAVQMPLYAQFARQLGEEMYEAIRKTYVDCSTCVVQKECQTSQAMALFYNVFTEEEKPKAFSVLMDGIRREDYRFTCGVLGLRVLFHVLADNGEAELAYQMITRPEFPSYAYWLNKGETTFLERFLEYDDCFESSKNHHWLGDIVNWFMRCVGGLHVQNASTVIVKPCFIERLTQCTTTHQLPKGKVAITWRRQDDKVFLQVECSGEVTYRVEPQQGYTLVTQETGTYVFQKN